MKGIRAGRTVSAKVQWGPCRCGRHEETKMAEKGAQGRAKKWTVG